MKKKIAVLVSGGVDSSVALKLLKEQGHPVTAVYLKIWLEDELSFLGNCPWEEDLRYVHALCKQEDIPLKVISLQREYHQEVVAYTISEVKKGRTPNPDILCNQRIKFGVALDHLKDDFDLIATGHYAGLKTKGGKRVLLRAPDPIKDQTYFLSYLRQNQLQKVLFPLGEFNKGQVRALAKQYELPTATRKDSQGICFLGKLKFADFIAQYVGQKPGALVEVESGQQVGTHNGFYFYTIGQRQRIGLAGGPWYVTAKDPSTNSVFISRSYYSKDKERNGFVVQECNWISGVCPEKKSLVVKLRHGSDQYKAEISYLDTSTVQVRLTERDQGIAAGQFAVFYDGDECLGSGVIGHENKKAALI